MAGTSPAMTSDSKERPSPHKISPGASAGAVEFAAKAIV
jgi:hypothetical protein